jgi:vancomycin resistance protein VanJ
MDNMPGMPRILASAWWLFGSTVLAGVVLRRWFGDELVVTRYTGYVMPWLLLGLLPGAAWACVRRRWPLAAILGASAATIIAVHAPLFRSHPPFSPPGAVLLRVMSYNTWSKNTDATRIARVILHDRPDVLLLQEIPAEVLAGLTNALRDLYGGSAIHVAYDAALLQAIVSRYSIEPSTSFVDKGNAQTAVIRSPGGPITVFNVHPLRAGGWRDRYSQITALLEDDVLPALGPVILGGDFNAPDRSQLYGMVSSALANAHEERGSGFGFTYPAYIRSRFGAIAAVPLVRIDHIFFTDHFVAVRAGTIDDSGGSDHRPVFADLALGADVGRSTNAAADLGPGAAQDEGQRAAKHRAVEGNPVAERRHEARRAR